VGVDVEVAVLTDQLIGRSLCRIIAHPMLFSPIWLAESGVDDEVMPGRSSQERNRDIVNLSEVIIILPEHMFWRNRGPTWFTHDYAKQSNKPVYVVWPNGAVTYPDGFRTEPISRIEEP
jgi:hypothetical protein